MCAYRAVCMSMSAWDGECDGECVHIGQGVCL